eukprot:PhM_4_TR10024/c2_g1_i1/m.94894
MFQKSSLLLVVLLVVALLVSCTEAAGGIGSLYKKGGDLVLRYPADTVALFFAVIVLTVVLEITRHRLNHHHDWFVRGLYTAMSNEMLSVGVIALALMFLVASIQSAVSQRWLLLFEWAHMTLFLMMLSFLSILLLYVWVLGRIQSNWEQYEKEIVAESGNVPLSESFSAPPPKKDELSVIRRAFVLARAEFLFELDGLSVLKHISYAQYLRCATKATLLALVHFSTFSWVVIIVVSVFVGARGFFLDVGSEDVAITVNHQLANIISFTLLVGTLPAIGLAIMATKLQMNLDKFLARRSTERTADVRPYLLFGSSDRTLQVMQIPLVLNMYHFAMLLMGLLYEAIVGIGHYRYLVIPMCFMPFFLTLGMLPWCVVTYTMLLSLGSGHIDDAVLARLSSEAKHADHGDHEHEHEHHHEELLEIPLISSGDVSSPVSPPAKSKHHHHHHHH